MARPTRAQIMTAILAADPNNAILLSGNPTIEGMEEIARLKGIDLSSLYGGSPPPSPVAPTPPTTPAPTPTTPSPAPPVTTTTPAPSGGATSSTGGKKMDPSDIKKITDAIDMAVKPVSESVTKLSEKVDKSTGDLSTRIEEVAKTANEAKDAVAKAATPPAEKPKDKGHDDHGSVGKGLRNLLFNPNFLGKVDDGGGSSH